MKNNDDYEIRFAEVRAAPDEGGVMIIDGYAVEFDKPVTHKLRGKEYTEIITRKALDNAITDNVPLRYNHNDTFMIMAGTKNKSLEMQKDDYGLRVRAELIDTQTNRDLYKAISNGLISGMSLGFKVAPGGDKWEYTKGGVKRVINAIEKIVDVSVVDKPFYDGAIVCARSAELFEAELARFEYGGNAGEDIELLKLKIKMRGMM